MSPLASSTVPSRRRSPSPEVVAQARVLVEGTALSLGAITKATGLGRRVLRRLIVQEGWQRPAEAPRGRRGKPPEILVRMQALWEGTTMTQVAIAREVGVHANHVSHCIRRGRWVRPLPEGAPGTPVAVRWPKRDGRPFRIDVIAELRDLYTGTVLPLKAIAARTGVSFASVSRLGRQHGWVRPEGAPTCPRHHGLDRSGPGRRLKEARRRVRALAESWADAWEGALEPAAATALGRARRVAARAAAPAP